MESRLIIDKISKRTKFMNDLIENRRDFLKRASMAAIAFPFLVGCKGDILAQRSETSILSLIKKNANTSPEINWCGAIDAPDTVSWRTALTKKSDADQAILISGTVFQSDGKTPAPNVLIYFYHTDSTGHYGRGNGEVRHGHAARVPPVIRACCRPQQGLMASRVSACLVRSCRRALRLRRVAAFSR